MSSKSYLRSRSLQLIIFFISLVHICLASNGQAQLSIVQEEKPLSSPNGAIDRIQREHSEASPVMVTQGELDNLIAADGGGACPLSAALIGLQGLRVMADLPMHPHPHRLALQLFQAKPKLKEGRISNERFVDMLAFLCKELDGAPVAITTFSAPNSEHAGSGQRWSEVDGPDLSTSEGELKFLAYTVTTVDGTVRGRHFVLLKQSDGRQLSFLNPGRPEKVYTFIVEYRGDTFESKGRVFFHNPAGIPSGGQTFELNTIFNVRLIPDAEQPGSDAQPSVEFTNAKIDELATRLRSTDEFLSPTAWRRHGAAFGLPGLDLPTEVGGGGWPAVKMLQVFRHAGEQNLNLRDVVGGAHGRPLAKVDSEYSRQVLGKLVSGEAYVAVAITEAEAGTDMKAMQSIAVKHDKGFKLTGRKLWNARLRQATHVVIYTLAANGVPGSRTAFLVPIDHPGLKVVDRYAHGLTGNSFGGLEFEDMFVGPEHLLGDDGDGGKIFDEHFMYWRLMQAAAAIGCGEGALDQMAERIQERHAFGGPIGRFTHLQQPIGEHLTKLRMAISLAHEAAELIDAGDYKAASPLVNGLKAEGVEIALAAADAAMRAHGAMGYSREVDLGDRVRDLMGLRIADGTTDVMRMTVVKEKFGSELWKMAVHGNQSDASEKAEMPSPKP